MSETTLERAPLLRRALGLEYLTIGWNVLEGVVAVAAASAASSIALLGFGVDSFVECASGLVLVWRLRTRDVLGGGARSAPPLLFGAAHAGAADYRNGLELTALAFWMLSRRMNRGDHSR